MTSPPLRLLGLDHVVLRCTNLDAMLEFYQSVLGMEQVRSVEKLGLYQLRAGASLIDLVVVGSSLGGQLPPRREHANMAHLCLRLDAPDWNQLLAHLAAAGLAPGVPENRFGADGTGPSVYVEDPEGNVVELKGDPV